MPLTRDALHRLAFTKHGLNTEPDYAGILRNFKLVRASNAIFMRAYRKALYSVAKQSACYIFFNTMQNSKGK